MRAPCRVVHMFSAHPQPTTRSAWAISSAASGLAKPPEMPSDHGLPVNRPLATAEVASKAPHRLASRSSSARACRAPRPAMNTGRRALVIAVASAALAGGFRRWGSASGRYLGRSHRCRLGLHVERQVEDHGAAFLGGAPHRPHNILDRGRRGQHPVGECADRGGERRLIDVEVRPRSGGLGGEHEHRGAALGRFGDAGHGVGQAATLVDRQHAELAAGARVSVRHGGRAALVPGRDIPGAARDHRIGDVEVAAADHTEDVVGPQTGQGAPHRLRDRHRSTRASTRVGLPEPPTIGSGAASSTAPVAAGPKGCAAGSARTFPRARR